MHECRPAVKPRWGKNGRKLPGYAGEFKAWHDTLAALGESAPAVVRAVGLAWSAQAEGASEPRVCCGRRLPDFEAYCGACGEYIPPPKAPGLHYVMGEDDARPLRPVRAEDARSVSGLGRLGAGPVFALRSAVSDRAFDAAATLVRHEAQKLVGVASTCGTVPLVVHPPGQPGEAKPFWNFCRTRGCPRCVTIRRAQTARRMVEAVEYTARAGHLEGLIHVTLTQVGRYFENYRQAVDRIGDAIAKLKRTELWGVQVRDEFVCIEAVPKVDHNGWRWHVHAHVLCNASSVDQPSLKAEWLRITGDSSVVWVTRKVTRREAFRMRRALLRGQDCYQLRTAREAVREACKYPQKMADLELGDDVASNPFKLGILADWLINAKGIRHYRPGGLCRCRHHRRSFEHLTIAGGDDLDYVGRAVKLSGVKLRVRNRGIGRWRRGNALHAKRFGKLFSRRRSMPGLQALGRILVSLPEWVRAAEELAAGEVCDPRACWRHTYDDLLDPPGVHVPGDVSEIARRAVGSAYYAEILRGLLAWEAASERGPPNAVV